jgi:hypothetical protein
MNEEGVDSNVVDGILNLSTIMNAVPTTGMISINTTLDDDNSNHTYLLQSILSYVGTDNDTNSDNSLLQHILSYVGNYQYRFVALVNRKFYDTYVTVLKKKKSTYCNTSSMELAKICYKEIRRKKLYYLCKSAIIHGNNDVLQDLVDFKQIHMAKYQRSCLFTSAMTYGNIPYLQYSLCKGTMTFEKFWSLKVTHTAVQYGHIHVLEWLQTTDVRINWYKLMVYAVEFENRTMMKWLYEYGGWKCSSAETCAYAAEHGHFLVLQWLHELGCPWDKQTCSNAACKGNLDLLKWARTNGCPWDEDTCANAA